MKTEKRIFRIMFSEGHIEVSDLYSEKEQVRLFSSGRKSVEEDWISLSSIDESLNSSKDLLSRKFNIFRNMTKKLK